MFSQHFFQMWIVLYVICLLVRISMGITNYTFPSHFLFGFASSAYQIEGAWNEDGKSVQIWDTLTHEYPESIKDRSSGDIACDSYHLYKEDVKMLKQVGVDFYRFSISWSRILPTGFTNNTNKAGIDYYNNLINELLNNGIEPFITIFHWDLPQFLHDMGGLTSKKFPYFYEMYAEILFANFGHKVKWWITFNEPAVAVLPYGKNSFISMPVIKATENGNYLATHNVLLAHSKVYHLYKRKYRPQQKGKISISLYSAWFEPYSNSTEDKAAAERSIQFLLGIFAHPIFSNEGDYPAVVKERLANPNVGEGLQESRLPKFTQEEIELLRGSADFFALNHYTTLLARDGEIESVPSLVKDAGATFVHDPKWKSTALQINKVVPWGFGKLLVWVSNNYNNPPILITENGYADQGQLNDIGRIKYIMDYLKEILIAMNEKDVSVFGYTIWSLMDSFEWADGYTVKFGMFHVDLDSKTRNRTPKKSAKLFSEVIKTRAIPPRYTNAGEAELVASKLCVIIILLLLRLL